MRKGFVAVAAMIDLQLNVIDDSVDYWLVQWWVERGLLLFSVNTALCLPCYYYITLRRGSRIQILI